MIESNGLGTWCDNYAQESDFALFAWKIFCREIWNFMLCGVNHEKVACADPPRSPASTAGNSTPPLSASSSHFISGVLEEVVEDVLIIS